MSLREQKKQQTRQLILKVAEGFFNQLEFEQVTIDELATAAGISRKTFFNYFPSKAKVLEEIICEWMAQSSLWASEPQLGNDAEAALIPPDIDRISQWVIEHRRLLKMVEKYTELFQSNFDHGEQYQSRIYAGSRKPRLARVQQAQQAGAIRKDIDAEIICQMYDALRLDAVRYWLKKPDHLAQAKDFYHYYNALKAVLLKGIQP